MWLVQLSNWKNKPASYRFTISYEKALNTVNYTNILKDN